MAARRRLTDYMIGGRYWAQWGLVMTHGILQVTVYILLFLSIGRRNVINLNSNAENVLSLIIIFGIIGGIFIWIAVAFWVGKAFRARRTIKALGKTGAESALNELLASGKTRFSSREVLFGDHFAFFFQSGSVIAYSNIRELHISRIPVVGFRIWNHDLMGKTIAGTWFLLVREKVYGRKPEKTELLRGYINALLARNPDITVSDK